MDKGIEKFVRAFFLDTKKLNDKELSEYLHHETYRNIASFEDKPEFLNVVYEVIAENRNIDLGKFETELIDQDDQENISEKKQSEIKHRIVLIFTNHTFTEIENKIVRLPFKYCLSSEDVVFKYLENKNIDYTSQFNGVHEYISGNIHNVNHIYYIFKEECPTSVFDITPNNKEDVSIWIEYLNKISIFSKQKDFSNRIENKKATLKKLIK